MKPGDEKSVVILRGKEARRRTGFRHLWMTRNVMMIRNKAEYGDGTKLVDKLGKLLMSFKYTRKSKTK